MISGNNSRRLVELAFDYIAAESEPQGAQIREEATKLAAATATLKVWLELIDYIKAWDSKSEHNYPISRGSALQFLLTRQAELEPSPTRPQEQDSN